MKSRLTKECHSDVKKSQPHILKITFLNNRNNELSRINIRNGPQEHTKLSFWWSNASVKFNLSSIPIMLL